MTGMILLRGMSLRSPMDVLVKPARPNLQPRNDIMLANRIRPRYNLPEGHNVNFPKDQPIGNERAISSQSHKRRRLPRNNANEDRVTVKTTLQLSACGAALFLAGALVTAVALGEVKLPGAELDRPAIEKIVRDYLLSHPEIIAQLSDKLDAQQEHAAEKARQDALTKLGTKALLDPEVAYVAGPADAKVTVAEFFDYRCPHCKASLLAMQHLLASGQDVRVAFIEHPILTPDSVIAARAAVAARRQGGKYVPFHFALMASAGELPKERILDIAKTVGLDVGKLAKDMDDPAVIESVKQSNALAERLHFDGTPTFVINDKIVVGEVTDAELQEMTRSPKG
jgi:protein-disulfide isomerase